MTEGKIEVKPARFLVCVDDTEHARVALKLACTKAKRLGGSISILHITDTSDMQNFLLAPSKIRNEKEGEGNAVLQKIAKEAFEYSGIHVTSILKSGVVGEKIVEAVEEDIDCSMLVVGAAPDAGGKTKRLIPWLTSQLGNKLLIPILIVPGNLTDQQIEALS